MQVPDRGLLLRCRALDRLLDPDVGKSVTTQDMDVIYSPIEHDLRTVRVFVLAAGEEHETISGALVHCTLDQALEYEALSYTWDEGGPAGRSSKVMIAVNGCPLEVTANLYAALCRLRSTEEDRCLWVDAICINQQDLTERSKHVRYMHLVYQHATRVVVWLGRASEDSHIAFAQLRALTELCASAMDGVENWPSVIDAQLARRVASVICKQARCISGDPWLPLARLFYRPWWRRVWIIQEVRYASSILVRCGELEAPWEAVVLVAEVLKELQRSEAMHTKHAVRHRADSTVLGLATTGLDYLSTQYLGKELGPKLISFEKAMLEYALVCRSTDPRDKVFALLNLMSSSDQPCEPDYTKSVVDVFTETTLHIIERSGDLRVLAWCGSREWPFGDTHLRRPYRRDMPVEGLPSWCLDWSSQRVSRPFCGGIQATSILEPKADLNSRWTVSGNKLLGVQAVLVGSIQHVSQLWGNRPVDFEHPALYEALGQYCMGKPGDERNYSLEWSLLFCDGSNRLHAADNSKNYCGSSRSVLDGIDTNGSPSLKSYSAWREASCFAAPPRFTQAVARRLMGRQICIDDSGHIGLGPFGMLREDSVALVESCHVPLVLRRNPSGEPDRYCIIGEADFPQMRLDEVEISSRRQTIILE